MSATRFRSLLPIVVGLVLIAWCAASPAFGDWIAVGDRVVTVAEAPVMDGSTRVTTFEPGTAFRAGDVQAAWVSVAQEIGGRYISGWVQQAHLVKIDPNQRPIYATHDNLTAGQGQSIKLPKGLPVTVLFQSDDAVDFFVVSEEGLSSYKWVAEHGSGQVSSYYRQWNLRNARFEWTPRDDRQYYVLVDNTSFPDGGARPYRTIRYSMVYCIQEARPDEPRSGRGLIIGRATLDFDGYQGRHERHSKPFKVIIKRTDADDTSQTMTASADEQGYFFLANVDPQSKYTVEKLDGDGFEAPVNLRCTSSFTGSIGVGAITLSRTESEAGGRGDARVLDLGHFSLRVIADGSVLASVAGPTFAASIRKEGDQTQTSVGFSNDTPLDRHAWFLGKFPDSGWASMVRSEQDKILKAREEAARKEREKEREEATRKQQAKESEDARNKDSVAEESPLPAAPVLAPAPPDPAPAPPVPAPAPPVPAPAPPVPAPAPPVPVPAPAPPPTAPAEPAESGGSSSEVTAAPVERLGAVPRSDAPLQLLHAVDPRFRDFRLGPEVPDELPGLAVEVKELELFATLKAEGQGIADVDDAPEEAKQKLAAMVRTRLAEAGFLTSTNEDARWCLILRETAEDSTWAKGGLICKFHAFLVDRQQQSLGLYAVADVTFNVEKAEVFCDRTMPDVAAALAEAILAARSKE